MFESICIRRQHPFELLEPLDLGFLAEAMLFYQSVHLIADGSTISQLVREWGSHLLIELLKEQFLKISYVEKIIGVAPSDTEISERVYLPVTVHPADGSWSLEKLAPEIFSKAAGGPGWGRQLGREFAGLVPTIDLDDKLISSVRSDFADQKYMEKAVAQLLGVLAPTYRLPQDYRFELFKEGNAFRLDTNIDFQQANEIFTQREQKAGYTLTPDRLLIYLFDARNDLFFASRENAELATQPTSAVIIDVKFREILRARSESQHNIEAFQELVLADGHEIGESIKSGLRTWRDFLMLLKEARKFKDWLRQQEPSDSLIHEYIKALEKETWLDKLPTKAIRFLIFTGGELLAPALGSIVLSFADTFVVDRLLGGWKPNQFVNGPLKGFARLD
jgi:hypothetical protein